MSYVSKIKRLLKELDCKSDFVSIDELIEIIKECEKLNDEEKKDLLDRLSKIIWDFII